MKLKNFFAKNRIYASLGIILLFLTSFIFAVRAFLVHNVLTWGDYAHQPSISLEYMLNQAFYIWNPSSLGTMPRMVASNFVLPLFIKLGFTNNYILYFIFTVLPFLLLSAAIYFITTRLLGKGNRITAGITALLYTASPVIFGDFLSGENLVVYGTLPFVVYFTIKIYFEEQFTLRNIVLLSLAIFITFGFLPPLIIPLLILLAFFVLIRMAILIDDKKYLTKAIFTSLLLGTLFGLLSLPYLIAVPSGQNTFALPTAVSDYLYNYSQMTLINSSRLAGNQGNGQWVLNYNEFNLTNLAGYGITFILIIGSAYVYRKKGNYNEKYLFSALTLMCLSIVIFFNLLATNSDFGIGFFNYSWLVATIRNPSKILTILSVFYCVAFAISFSTLLKALEVKWKKMSLVLLTLTLILTYGWPILRGDFGLFYQANLLDTNYDLNPIVQEIADRANQGDGRSIIIPSDHDDELNFVNESASLNTIRVGGALPATDSLNISLIDTFNNEDDNFFNLANIAGIQMIFLKKNYDPIVKPYMVFPSQLDYSEAFKFLSKNYSIAYDGPDFTQFVSKIANPVVYSPTKIANLPDNSEFDSIGALYGTHQTVIDDPINSYSSFTATYQASSTLYNLGGANSTLGILFAPNIIILKVSKTVVGTQSYLILEKIDPINEDVLSSTKIRIPKNTDSVTLDGNKIALNGALGQKLTVRSGQINLVFNKLTKIDISSIDPSFENSGTLNVGDATLNKTGEPLLSGSPNKDSTEGKNSFMLSTTNHTAFIYKNLPSFNNENDYELTFDYKNISGNAASYAVWQEGTVNLNLPRGDLAPSQSWQTAHISLAKNRSTNKISLYLYSSSNGIANTKNLFDNISLFKLQVMGSTTIQVNPYPSTLNLGQYSNSNLKPLIDNKQSGSRNLIQNGSFEASDLWGSMGDANSGAPGLPAISISQSSDSVDGKYSLSLNSSNHTAYVSNIVSNFKANAVYKLSFEYKNISGLPPAFSVWQSKVNKPVLYKTLDASKQWNLFEENFVPDAMAESLSVFLYSTSSGEETVNLFDSVRIEKQPLIKTYLSKISDAQNTPVSLVNNFAKVNQTYYKIDIKNTAGLIVLNESFHDGWKAFLKTKVSTDLSWWQVLFMKSSGIEVPQTYHVAVNGFANGWWIDPQTLAGSSTGEYEVILEFWPQRLFYAGLTISGATLIGCLGYLICLGLMNIRRKYRTHA